MKNIDHIVSQLTFRKIPILMGYELALVAYLLFFGSSDQKYQLAVDGWFFGLGFLSLMFLEYFEKRKGLPLPYATRIGKRDYLLATLICIIGIQVTLAIFQQLALHSLFPFTIIEQFLGFASLFNTVWNFQFGIVEESFKMAMINVLGVPALLTRRKLVRKAWIFGVGTLSVFTWAYMHILTGAYYGEYAFADFLVAFVAGMVFLIVTIWKENYLPAVFVHGVYDVLTAFGFVI